MQLHVSWYVCCRASSMRCLWYAPARFPQMKMITLARIWGHKDHSIAWAFIVHEHNNTRYLGKSLQRDDSAQGWFHFCTKTNIFIYLTKMDPICFLDPCPLTGDFAVLPYLWAQPCDLLGRKAMTNLDSILKSWDITLPTKVCLVKAMIFPLSHVWMWELDHEEGWALKNWCFLNYGVEDSWVP